MKKEKYESMTLVDIQILENLNNPNVSVNDERIKNPYSVDGWEDVGNWSIK